MAATKKKTEDPTERSAAIVLPTVRGYRSWSPQLITSAEYAADGGNIRLAVDLCEWLIGDDKVRGSLDDRIDAVFCEDVAFDASGDRRRRDRAVKALEVGEDWDAMFPEPEARQVMRWAILLGMGPGVMRWEVRDDHGRRDIPRLEFYHPQPMRYDWGARSWKTKGGTGNGSEELVTFGDGVWFGHMPFGTFRPWSLGLWRALARWVLLKQYAISDWGRAGEAAVRQVVTADKEAKNNKDLRLELAGQIQEMGRDGVIVLPPGFDYKTIELSASTKDLYDAQIKTANLAIAIAIKGRNLTTDVQGGSRSATEVHERGDERTARSDAGNWSSTAHEQVLTYWAGSNFADPNLAPWPAFDVEPEEDADKAVTRLKTLGEAIQQLSDAGLQVDTKTLAERYDVPLLPEQHGSQGKIFQYHLTFQTVTTNEVRARLGLPPVKDGNKPPTPVQAAPGEPAANARWDLGGGIFAHAHEHGIGLASGAAAGEAPGFVEGQIYSDALVEGGTELATDAVQPTLDAVLEELRAAKDYDDLRARLRKRYADLSADEFTELVYRHMVVAELAGRHAVNRDANR